MQNEDIFIPCSASQRVLLKAFFDELGLASSIPNLYWLPVPEELLTDLQAEHQHVCGPYIMALDVGEAGISLETLVRAQNQMHCECISFAGIELVQHILDYLNMLLVKKIKVQL